MPPKVYHHDHTAGVRARLAHLAATGVIGLLLAAAGAAVTTVIVRVGDGQPSPPGLVRAVWVGVASVAALSVVTLLVCAVAWLVYRRRRAQLDAAGAEAVGELLAKAANRRRPGQHT